MNRRRMLKLASAALGLPVLAGSAQEKRRKVLYFTRSAGFEHSVVKRKDGQLSHSENVFKEFTRKFGFDVECTKDGRVFDGSLDQYDVIAFYTTGDLTGPSKDGSEPMTAAGKKKLLDAIAAGQAFLGIHSATDTFHSKGPRGENQTDVDPYIAMLGGEFVTHGAQQEASLFIATPKFPVIVNLVMADGIGFTDEWYTFKNFARDMNVIFVQETKMMKGEAYRRPDFPATWARYHGKGRVFYTSLGHREDMWTNPFFQAVVLGGLEWTSGKTGFDIKPNIDAVAPQASQLKGV